MAAPEGELVNSSPSTMWKGTCPPVTSSSSYREGGSGGSRSQVKDCTTTALSIPLPTSPALSVSAVDCYASSTRPTVPLVAAACSGSRSERLKVVKSAAQLRRTSELARHVAERPAPAVGRWITVLAVADEDRPSETRKTPWDRRWEKDAVGLADGERSPPMARRQ